MNSVRLPLFTLSALVAFASGLRAETAAAPEPTYKSSNKESYTLINPVPKELMREMNTDRPDTTESPITVDAGHFQVEASFFDYNRDKTGGVKTEAWTFGEVNLKAGLFDRTDIQFVFDTYTTAKTTGGGASSTANGMSDLTIRLKQNLWGVESDSKTAFALMPWISAPTGSDGLSADKYQGGLIAPLSIAVSDTVGLGTMIQADVLWDGVKYYVEWTHSLTCGVKLTEDLGLYVEYVGRHDSGTASNYRASGNTGVTYALNANLILDAGVRIGLNSRADDFGAFTGISYRY